MGILYVVKITQNNVTEFVKALPTIDVIFFVDTLKDVINNSDHQAVLRLSNLVEGMYKFRLTVADGKGLKGNDDVVLTIKEGMRLISISFEDRPVWKRTCVFPRVDLQLCVIKTERYLD